MEMETENKLHCNDQVGITPPLLQGRNPNFSREEIFRAAMMQPIIQVEAEESAPARRNSKISKDPASAAARRRRERISERIRILRRMVPGGTRMDTASMLDEAVHYLKFLQRQLQSLQEQAAHAGPSPSPSPSPSPYPYPYPNPDPLMEEWFGYI